MVIEKVINNNIVSAVDEEGREAVVMGRGIGFRAKPGTPLMKKELRKSSGLKAKACRSNLRNY